MAGKPGRRGAAANRYDVLLTRGAKSDLEAIHDYITQFDCVESADYVLDRLMVIVDELAMSPERGSYPKELSALGIREFRQVMFKPYRAIYRVLGNRVVIHLIVDGRRNLQSLLARRLLGA